MTITSDPASEISILTFFSEIYSKEKTLYILRSKTTFDIQKEVKILLLQDGDDLFSTISNRSWMIDKIISQQLEVNRTQNLVIVGVAIDRSNRAKEYLPWEDDTLSPPEQDPIGYLYPRFLIDEIVPRLIEFLGISNDQIDWGIGGSSYGALISLYSSLQLPIFDFLLMESPSLYVFNQQILEQTEQMSEKLPNHIYIGVGSNELGLKDCNEDHDDNKMAVDDCKLFSTLVMNNRPDISLSLIIERCGEHTPDFWSKRFITALSTWV